MRRREMATRKEEELGREAELMAQLGERDLAAVADDEIEDDLLSLIFTACHPVLATEARVAIEVPGAAEREQRLTSVLEVIYAIFNEGYAASGGEAIPLLERLGRAEEASAEFARAAELSGSAPERELLRARAEGR